jgi:glutathionyl-hydroquinone reductase
MLATHAWADVIKLSKALHVVRNISYSVKAQRDMARRTLSGAIVDSPFSRVKRFAEGVFVDLGFPTVSKLYNQLIGSLDVHTRDVEKERVDSGRYESGFNDAKQAFINAVESLCFMLDAVDAYSVNGIYDMESFEDEFNLVWTEAEEPGEDV